MSQCPYLWSPRSYQRRMFIAREQGVKRFIEIWPRRGGKDQGSLNLITTCMCEVPGTYFHVFPELSQGKRIIWTELTSPVIQNGKRVLHGFKYLEHFPRDLCLQDGRAGRNETELTVDFANGAKYQIQGSDRPDRLRGSNPIGVVFSEAAMISKETWDIVEPILEANGGWALFNTTPQPDSWLEQLWNATEGDPAWHRSIYQALPKGVYGGIDFGFDDREVIRRDGMTWGRDVLTGAFREIPEDGSTLYTREWVESALARGTDPAWINQEIFCSWRGARVGSYYGKLIAQAEAEGRC